MQGELIPARMSDDLTTRPDGTFADIQMNAPVQPSIDTILAKAIESGRSTDELGRLLDVYERMKAIQREAEFNEAFAKLQAACPTIRRDKNAKIVTGTGTSFGYNYASLDEIERVVLPVLADHGFSRSYDSKLDGGNLLVVCRLSHRSGHSREACFPCPTESKAGMTAAQKYGAALTYARRQSFVSVCGLSVGDPDTDGAEDHADSPKQITDEQVKELNDALIAKWDKRADEARARLLRSFKVEKLSDLTTASFDEAMRRIETAKVAT